MRKPPNHNVRLARQEYHNSKELEDNPHPKGTDNYRAWRRGWLAEHKANSLD